MNSAVSAISIHAPLVAETALPMWRYSAVSASSPASALLRQWAAELGLTGLLDRALDDAGIA